MVRRSMDPANIQAMMQMQQAMQQLQASGLMPPQAAAGMPGFPGLGSAPAGAGAPGLLYIPIVKTLEEHMLCSAAWMHVR
jgi:hypothetical protein